MKCECEARMAGECMCGAWDDRRPLSAIAAESKAQRLERELADKDATIATLKAALREACEIASTNVGRCSHLSDFVGRGALTDTALCNNLMPCPAHGELPRIAELRKLADTEGT